MDDRGIDYGTPGASARREYERRRDRRERRTREQHPRLAGLLRQSAPHHETAWANGALGEELLAARLAKRCPAAIVLHDRRLPNSRANIDHLAIAPSGVFVIDAKHYSGKVRVEKPRRGESRLLVDGRDKTKLLSSLARQQQAVAGALAAVVPEMPIHACLCFLPRRGGGLATFTTPRIDGFALLTPRKLAKRLNSPGALTPASLLEVAELLARELPRA